MQLNSAHACGAHQANNDLVSTDLVVHRFIKELPSFIFFSNFLMVLLDSRAEDERGADRQQRATGWI